MMGEGRGGGNEATFTKFTNLVNELFSRVAQRQGKAVYSQDTVVSQEKICIIFISYNSIGIA